MGWFKPIQQWWEVRREARKAHQQAKKAHKAAVAAAKARSELNVNVDEIPLSAMAPTQRKYTAGGFAFSYELAPAVTPNLPRLTPAPDSHQDLASLIERRKMYEGRFNLGSRPGSRASLDDGSTLADALDARCRKARNVKKLAKILRLGGQTDAARTAADGDVGGSGGSGNGAHFGGSPSQ